MIRTLSLLLFAALFTGCVGISRPDAQVTSVRLDQSSDLGARILVDVKLTNDNDEALPIPKVSYRLQIVGGDTFELTDRAYAALPKSGQVVLTLPAAVRGSDLKGKAYRVDGEVVYRPTGELRQVLYDNYVPLPRSRFSREGVLK